MKAFWIIIFIILAVSVLVLLTHTQNKTFSLENAKAMCRDYCRLGCKLNNSESDMQNVWNIEIIVEKTGSRKCSELVGNCLC
jgi:hypothetical protein